MAAEIRAAISAASASLAAIGSGISSPIEFLQSLLPSSFSSTIDQRELCVSLRCAVSICVLPPDSETFAVQLFPQYSRVTKESGSACRVVANLGVTSKPEVHHA